MIGRRGFLHMAIGTAALTHARPASAAARQTGVAGANDRIRVGLIGCGGRGNQVARDWMKHKDSVFVAACDVYKSRLDETVARIAGIQGAAPEAYEQYQRILERTDVDAVLIATPDHWHGPMTLDACAAGKDVYVEKPVSNSIDDGLRMIEAARRHNRVVQVGLQQRSWHHFQEARQLFADGYLGSPITHCTMVPPGGRFPRRTGPQAPQDPPAGLNWDLFQGPAERRPFVPARLNWRSWYAYGGGNLSDWGVHLTDVMNWFMNADQTAPLLTSASTQYVRLPQDPELVPDSYAVTWQYKDFVASLANTMIPGVEDARQLYGNHFYGERGVMIVNRLGYEVRPYPPPPRREGQPPPEPPLEPKKFKDPNAMSEVAESKYGSATHHHVRNFLDAVRSRQRPNCDVEVGFYSALPCLLALVSVQTGKTVRWDGKAAQTT
jgi:predicted dehydrogenase